MEKILLVEDDIIDQMAFKRAVKSGIISYEYEITESVTDAVELLKKGGYDIVITDYELGDGTGFEVLEAVDKLPVIFVTGAGDEMLAVNAMKMGAYDYLIKDAEHHYLQILPITVKNAINFYRSMTNLEESEKRYTELFENTSDLIQSVNGKGEFLFVNNAWEQALGYSSEEVKDLNLFEIIHPDSLKHCEAVFARISKGENVGSIEAEFITKEGSKLIVRGNSSIKQSKDGVVTRSIFHDVTSQIQAERMLMKINEELENKVSKRTEELASINSNLRQEIEERIRTEEELKQINDELNTFIYKTSHDIRGPLSSVMGLVNLAKLEARDAGGEPGYFDHIEERIGHLDAILNELTNVTRIKEGVIDISPIDFNEVVQEIIDSIRHMPSFNEIRINTKIELKDKFYSDRHILNTILNNLTVNAVKYRDQDRNDSFLNLKIEGSNGQLSITAEDNGIGISEKARTKVFDMFYRGTELSTGSGLGLYIVKKGVRKLEGDIEMESETGAGTTFRIIIPNNSPQ